VDLHVAFHSACSDGPLPFNWRLSLDKVMKLDEDCPLVNYREVRS